MISFNGSGLAQAPNGRDPRRNAVALLQRSHLAMLVILLLLTVGAWSLSMAERMGDMPGAGTMGALPDADAATGPGMAEMVGPGWSLGGLAAFVVSWAIMMAAMMLPAVAPLLLLYRTIAGKSMSRDAAFISTWVLVLGYLLVWTAVGVGVYGLTRLGGELARAVGLAEQTPWLATGLGTVLILAGLYQFTPLKVTCLRHCQSPFGFIMGHWRSGTAGALRMGVVHGLYCLGCCWALFAVLVAAGVMSLAWMLLLTLVVFAEKVLPWGRRTTYGVGAAFLVLGILVVSGRIAPPGMV